MNRVSELLPLRNVVLGVQASDKQQAFAAAAELFEANQHLDPRKVVACLSARESLGSTGLGQEVAIPHGRLRGLKHAVAAILRLAAPVAFDAPDGRPVRLLVVLLVPEHASQQHLDLLSELAQMLADRDFREKLLGEPDAAALHARIAAWEPIRPAA